MRNAKKRLEEKTFQIYRQELEPVYHKSYKFVFNLSIFDRTSIYKARRRHKEM